MENKSKIKKEKQSIPVFMGNTPVLIQALDNAKIPTLGVIKRLDKAEEIIKEKLRKYLRIYNSEELAEYVIWFDNIKQKLHNIVDEVFEDQINTTFKKGVKIDGSGNQIR